MHEASKKCGRHVEIGKVTLLRRAPFYEFIRWRAGHVLSLTDGNHKVA